MASSFPLVIASTLFALLSLAAILVSVSTSSWYLVQTDDATTHFGTFQICSEIRNVSDSKVCHRADSQDFIVVGDNNLLASPCRRSASELSLRFGSLFGILIVAAVLCLVSIAILVIAIVKAFLAKWWRFRTDEQIAESHRQEEEEQRKGEEHQPSNHDGSVPSPQPTTIVNPITTQSQDKPTPTTSANPTTKDTTILVDIHTTTTPPPATTTADPTTTSSSNEVSNEESDDDDEGYDVEYNVMPTLEIIPMAIMTVVVFITIIAWAAYISTVSSWLYCDNSPCAFLGQNDEITVCESSMGYGFAVAVFAWLSAMFSVFLLILRWVMLKVFGVDMPEEDEEMGAGGGGESAESPHDEMSPPDTLNNTRNSHTTTHRSLNNTLNRTKNGELSVFAAEDYDEDEQSGRVVMPSSSENDITSQGSGGRGTKNKKGSFRRGHFDPVMPHQVPEEEGDNSPDNHGSKRQGETKKKYPAHRIWRY